MLKNTTLLIFGFLFISCSGSSNNQKEERNAIKDPYYYQQWYSHRNNNFYRQHTINQKASINPSNGSISYTGKGIKIAVIDDGLDVLHEDLVGTIEKTYDIFSRSSNVSHIKQEDYHGTAVTGIIAARANNIGIKGIANNSKIIFLKNIENMSDSQTIELFNKAEEFGADIINCSWGTYNVSQIVKEKIQNLAKNGRNGKGTIFVFAAGNDTEDIQNDESNIKEVISVGASNKYNLRTYYSNYGDNLDILAPGGGDIGITTLDGMGNKGVSINNSYLLFDDFNHFIGTSASAPIVSASIALLLEKNPNLTRKEVENILKQTADKIGEISYIDGRNDYYGYGKLNLFKALEKTNSN
ncbi:MAG: S8 family serine peptidase [Arcobacter sp.]|nr:S8 family serine peptidase [Arcobacter sp.]